MCATTWFPPSTSCSTVIGDSYPLIRYAPTVNCPTRVIGRDLSRHHGGEIRPAGSGGRGHRLPYSPFRIVGCLAFGAGATDIANSWVTGLIRCKMPEILRIELVGRLRPGVAARDVVSICCKQSRCARGMPSGQCLSTADQLSKQCPWTNANAHEHGRRDGWLYRHRGAG